MLSVARYVPGPPGGSPRMLILTVVRPGIDATGAEAVSHASELLSPNATPSQSETFNSSMKLACPATTETVPPGTLVISEGTHAVGVGVGCTGVDVGGTGVAVGGTGVAVAPGGVAVPVAVGVPRVAVAVDVPVAVGAPPGPAVPLASGEAEAEAVALGVAVGVRVGGGVGVITCTSTICDGVLSELDGSTPGARMLRSRVSATGLAGTSSAAASDQASTLIGATHRIARRRIVRDATTGSSSPLPAAAPGHWPRSRARIAGAVAGSGRTGASAATTVIGGSSRSLRR